MTHLAVVLDFILVAFRTLRLRGYRLHDPLGVLRYLFVTIFAIHVFFAVHLMRKNDPVRFLGNENGTSRSHYGYEQYGQYAMS